MHSDDEAEVVRRKRKAARDEKLVVKMKLARQRSAMTEAVRVRPGRRREDAHRGGDGLGDGLGVNLGGERLGAARELRPCRRGSARRRRLRGRRLNLDRAGIVRLSRVRRGAVVRRSMICFYSTALASV